MGRPGVFNSRPCERCGVGLENVVSWTRFCDPCVSARAKAGGKPQARAVVNRAVRTGRLPRARTLNCVDCGGKALDYDHRDYSKPLDVEPVCRSCNKKRGPGIAAEGVVSAGPGVVSHRDEASLFLSLSTSPNESEELS